jgi:hypothetical protein
MLRIGCWSLLHCLQVLLDGWTCNSETGMLENPPLPDFVRNADLASIGGIVVVLPLICFCIGHSDDVRCVYDILLFLVIFYSTNQVSLASLRNPQPT